MISSGRFHIRFDHSEPLNSDTTTTATAFTAATTAAAAVTAVDAAADAAEFNPGLLVQPRRAPEHPTPAASRRACNESGFGTGGKCPEHGDRKLPDPAGRGPPEKLYQDDEDTHDANGPERHCGIAPMPRKRRPQELYELALQGDLLELGRAILALAGQHLLEKGDDLPARLLCHRRRFCDIVVIAAAAGT
ncbi:hypothetical protein DL768_010767 [Monosporascus sp. mg162]|nr:hypothetical protein DL768_010767 [Monosporascus sp. mg162]